MDKPPAFQFFPKDFLEGTAAMSNAERGAYINLLCHQWLKDKLPNERQLLIRFCNGDEQGIDTALKKFKIVKNNTLKNKRLETVKKNQKKYEKNKQISGKIGAKKRWHNKNKTKELDSTPIDLPLANGIANDSSASAASAAAKEKQASLLKEKVYEFMRRSRGKNYSDFFLEQQAEEFTEKFRDKKIGNLASLVNGWLENLRPDIKPKKMQV